LRALSLPLPLWTALARPVSHSYFNSCVDDSRCGHILALVRVLTLALKVARSRVLAVTCALLFLYLCVCRSWSCVRAYVLRHVSSRTRSLSHSRFCLALTRSLSLSLILTILTPIDYDEMAIQWCHHVDGIYICIQRVLRLFRVVYLWVFM